MNVLKYFDEPDVTRAISGIEDKNNIKILFVCLGNICRSPAAEGMMMRVVDEKGDAQRWTLDSAGTGNYHIGQLADPRMRAHARRRGIELTHHCRQVHESDFDDFDLIIGMDASNIANLKRLAPTAEHEMKVLPMAAFLSDKSHFDHIPDPYYDGAQGFETVLDLLDEATCNLYDTVTESLG